MAPLSATAVPSLLACCEGERSKEPLVRPTKNAPIVFPEKQSARRSPASIISGVPGRSPGPLVCSVADRPAMAGRERSERVPPETRGPGLEEPQRRKTWHPKQERAAELRRRPRNSPLAVPDRFRTRSGQLDGFMIGLRLSPAPPGLPCRDTRSEPSGTSPAPGPSSTRICKAKKPVSR